MSLGNLKFLNSFHILHRFIQKLSFSATFSSFKILKYFKLIYRLIQFWSKLSVLKEAIWFEKLWTNSIIFMNWIGLQKKIEFFKQTILHLKLLTSFHRLNRFAKTWVFQAGYLSVKILKLINSIHGLSQFAKKLRFLNRLFQLWRFCFFSKLLLWRNWFPIIFMQGSWA